MIIKELKIYSFGGITNKEINFKKGLNLIYGENEKGKSTIEAFIKVMLYGINSKKIKGISERQRYMPFSGNVIKGEMVVEYKNKDYILQRTFGATKKEDTSKVLDYLTGDEVKNIDSEMPGKYFLGVNRSTFEKTLFIKQLGVSFEKDKEEEIMEKITSMFGCGENEVPVERALKKLETIKKSLTTARGIGTLDLLRKKRADLLEERYEGYKIAEKNLDWENKLLIEKNKKKILKEELSKLEIYKKYIKKINIQKEYKEIIRYLKKSEELKEREKEISDDLLCGEEIINDSFIEDLKEQNREYLNLLDKKEELLHKHEELNNNLERINSNLEEYKFLDIFGDNLKDKLINLKYEQKNLKERLDYFKSLKLNFNKIQEKRNENKSKLGTIYNIKDFRDDLKEKLIDYEKNLKELKFLAETYDISEGGNLKRLSLEENKVLVGGLLLAIGLVILFLGYPLYGAISLVIGGVLTVLAAQFIFKGREEAIKEEIKEKNKIRFEELNNTIHDIEQCLSEYMKKIKVCDYTALISALKNYEIYIKEDERLLLKIEEINNVLNDENTQDIIKKYNKNYKIIESMKRMANCSYIDDIIEKVCIHDELVKQKEILLIDINSNNNNLEELKENINLIENKLREKLNVMNVDLESLLDIEIYIKKYKEKLRKLEEIHSTLLSIENTYKALLKDRDIESIKNDLKDILNDINDEYSYSSQEDIEVEEKNKSKELLECEKTIKDLENSINNRLLGKRNVVVIEEEISIIDDKIKKEEKKLSALNLALSTLDESFDEIKKEVGPEINRGIYSNFDILTSNKYKEIKLGNNYEMMVRSDENLFNGEFLSNGASDQLYLSLRLAFIDLIFEDEEEYTIILDDAFVQYDEKRREKALLLINEKIKGQCIIFTCQKIEEDILSKNNIDKNVIYI